MLLSLYICLEAMIKITIIFTIHNLSRTCETYNIIRLFFVPSQ
ncbi:glycosyltransferase [Bacillus clarus]|uniref:Glycosyltransferase n=1 Tax=Bacillus clarus TaxID=2338372 RepID=A0ABX9KSM2_9BACI|nr:glycosyltransferase [Bacillus clarus]